MEFDLKKDERWGIFFMANSPNSFMEWVIPEIEFKPEVNEEIVKSFNIIKKLLIHSYYEYEFFDVAGTLVLLKFEMALKIRYRELENKKWPEDKPLKQLINWFFERKYWEITDKSFFDNYRETRNTEAHPENNKLFGPLIKNQITTTVNLINDLYENIELRKTRLKLTSEANKKLHLIAQGAQLIEKDYSDIIYNGACLFVNNKVSPSDYYIFLCPIFSINEVFGIPFEKAKRTLRNYVTKKIRQTNSGIEFWDDVSDQMIKVIILVDKTDKETFNTWIANLKSDINLRLAVDSVQHDLSLEHQHIRKEFLKF